MKSRLLFISRKWPPAIGGMETYSLELVAGLEQLGEVHRLVLPGRSDGRAPGLWMYCLFLFRAIFFCARHARKFQNVVVGDLILFPAAVVHWLFNRHGCRIVVVYGLDLVYQKRRGILPLLYGLYFALFRASQRFFKRIVAISRYTRDLAYKQGLNCVDVINPCLPRSNFTAHDSNATLPTEWEEHRDGLRVLYYGRLIPRKGALWFAQEVMPQLPESTVFFVVGDSSNAMYKKALRSCSRAVCLGRMDADRLAMMIRQADLVVMPNIPTPDIDVEGFGLVAIETCALGGRLLAASNDGITDAVVDGITGTLLPSGDARAWRSTIEHFIQVGSSALPLPARAAEETRQRYSSEVQARAFMDLLGAESKDREQ